MKELFIFGAGASNASGRTPLGKNLIWDYFEDCSTFYQIEGGRPARHDIEAKKQEFYNFGLFLKTIENKFPNISPHQEWLRCMEDAMMYTPSIQKTYYIDEIMAYLENENDLDNIKLIKRLTLEHIAKTSIESHGQNSLYRQFVKYLKHKSPAKVSVISFNFDSLLHEDFSDKIYFDYLIDFKTISNVRAMSNNGEGILLIKLNGSLDWAFHPKTNQMHLLSFHLTERSYPSSEVDDDHMIEPYIFLPHQKKNGVMNILWARAEKEIKSASKITIIGYSFPHYDKDVIKLFRDNLQPHSKIEIIDKASYSTDRELREKMRYYNSIFPQVSNIDINFNGFEGYINGLK